jgi:hypothetical protein
MNTPAWPQRVRTNPSLTCCHSLREHILTPRGSLLRHSHPDRRLSVRVLKCASLLPSKHLGAVRLPLGARGLSACVSALLVGAPGRRLAVCCGGPLAVCLSASSAYGVAFRVSLCVPVTLLVGACRGLGGLSSPSGPLEIRGAKSGGLGRTPEGSFLVIY